MRPINTFLKDPDIRIEDAGIAFQRAIAYGTLSRSEHSWNYCGHFVYIQTIDGIAYFKHIISKTYLACSTEDSE